MKNRYDITFMNDDTITVITDDSLGGTMVHLEDLVRIYFQTTNSWVIFPWHQIKRVDVTRHDE